MVYVDLPIPERLSVAAQHLRHARDNEALAAHIAVRSYTPEKIAAGMALLETAKEKYALQIREYGEQYQLTDVHQKQLLALRQELKDLRDIARVIFKKDRLARKTMLLTKPLERGTAFSAQAETTLSNILATESLCESLAAYGYDKPVLTALQTRLTEVSTVKSKRDKERTEAQQATRDRDAALAALDEWIVDFQTIARVAVRAQPELMELLGDVVRS